MTGFRLRHKCKPRKAFSPHTDEGVLKFGRKCGTRQAFHVFHVTQLT